LYSILDIETTGGKFNEEGITEIAIYKFDGHTVVDQFISLVNPERPIQEFVVKLTGINNKMLKNAPKFYEIAKRIIEITDKTTLVAHNANFDYRILKTEFSRLGFDYKKDNLCTIELSKKLIPNQESYSLGKICKSLGIPISNRHRASGDAMATVKLFKILLEKDNQKEILQQTIKNHNQSSTKHKINRLIDTLPEEEGVFYLHDIEGRVIFIGKGVNMKAHLTKTLAKTSKRSLKIKERTEKVSFENTGNYLFTKLKYHLELDLLKPKFNYLRKRKKAPLPFAHPNFMILLAGRNEGENAIVLIENDEVFGYGYTNLAYQENQLEILKNSINPITNQTLAKHIVKSYLNSATSHKIIRF